MRVFTENEFIERYGKDWRDVSPNASFVSLMDSSFGVWIEEEPGSPKENNIYINGSIIEGDSGTWVINPLKHTHTVKLEMGDIVKINPARIKKDSSEYFNYPRPIEGLFALGYAVEGMPERRYDEKDLILVDRKRHLKQTEKEEEMIYVRISPFEHGNRHPGWHNDGYMDEYAGSVIKIPKAYLEKDEFYYFNKDLEVVLFDKSNHNEFHGWLFQTKQLMPSIELKAGDVVRLQQDSRFFNQFDGTKTVVQIIEGMDFPVKVSANETTGQFSFTYQEKDLQLISRPDVLEKQKDSTIPYIPGKRSTGESNKKDYTNHLDALCFKVGDVIKTQFDKIAVIIEIIKPENPTFRYFNYKVKFRDQTIGFISGKSIASLVESSQYLPYGKCYEESSSNKLEIQSEIHIKINVSQTIKI